MINKQRTIKVLMIGVLTLAFVLSGSIVFAKPGDNRNDGPKNNNVSQEERKVKWSDLFDRRVDTATTTTTQATTTNATTTNATSTATTTVGAVRPETPNQVQSTTAGVGLRSLRSIAGTMDKFLPLSSSYDSAAFSPPVTWMLSLLGLITGIAGILLAMGKFSSATESLLGWTRSRRNPFKTELTAH